MSVNPRVEGPKDEIWEVDETLRERATALVLKYTDQIGHVDLRHVVFVRVEGKVAKWLGKCYPIKVPHSILPKYTLSLLNQFGAIDIAKLKAMEYSYEENFDIKYIIALNSDLLSQVPQNVDKVIDILILHELMHVDPDMKKTEKHDSEDFKWILREFGVDWASGMFKEEVEATSVVEAVDNFLDEAEAASVDMRAVPVVMPPPVKG